MSWNVVWENIPRSQKYPMDEWIFDDAQMDEALDRYMDEVTSALTNTAMVYGEPIDANAAALAQEFIDEREETKQSYRRYLMGDGERHLPPAKVLKAVVMGECGMSLHSIYKFEGRP